MKNLYAVTIVFGGRSPRKLEIEANSKTMADIKALGTLSGAFRQDVEKVVIKQIRGGK